MHAAANAYESARSSAPPARTRHARDVSHWKRRNEIGGSAQTIGGAAAVVAHRREVARDGGVDVVQGLAGSRAGRSQRPRHWPRAWRGAPCRHRRRGIAIRLRRAVRSGKGGDHGGNVLVESLRQFVGGRTAARLAATECESLDDLARQQRSLTISCDEDSTGMVRVAAARSERHSRAERDQAREAYRRSEMRSRDCRRWFRDCGSAASRCAARARRMTENARRGMEAPRYRSPRRRARARRPPSGSAAAPATASTADDRGKDSRSLLTRSPRSVPPASRSASGYRARAASSSSKRARRDKDLLAVVDIRRIPATAASASAVAGFCGHRNGQPDPRQRAGTPRRWNDTRCSGRDCRQAPHE